KERERFFKVLRETQAKGVIILSGDRHVADLSMDMKQIGYPLYDITSSGFNQANKSWRAPEANKHRISSMSYGDNFGFINIDWSSETSPRISLQLRDEDGDVTVQQKIRLGMLKPNATKVAAAEAKATDKEKEMEKEKTPEKPLPEGVLSPAEAAKKVDENVVVQFEVKAARLSKGKLFLNSETDFRSEANFTVLLQGEGMKEKYKDATAETFKGKTIKVTGKVILYQKKPEIIIEDESKIEVVEK
ncbi:MAG: alkaline phosphatase D family protein, partial [Gemmataceae bacterium]